MTPPTLTRWLDLVGDQVSAIREAETGRVALTFFTPAEEELLAGLYADRMKPKAAARKILDHRRAS